MKRSYIFEADDGTTFDTAAECKAYEEWARLVEILSGIEPFRVAAALHREDSDLADAIERAGRIIAAKRRESGELRRKAKTDAEKFVDVGAAMKEKKP